MRKVLLTFLAVLVAVPAFAVEVYNNGDNSVAIYGHVRGYLGYGMGVNSSETSSGNITTKIDPIYNHNMLYGLQGNTRIGTNIKIGNFSGQIELGANEKTLWTQTTKDTVGFRQAWGAYTFGNGSKLVVGKTDTPTAMSGFNSDISDTDSGLNGFGGTATGVRRFQIQYQIAGLALALIEDDVAAQKITGFTDNAPYTPRGGISYTYKGEGLMLKVAATYTAVNGYYLTDTRGNLVEEGKGTKNWTNLHAGGIAVGVKPQFGNMWLSFVGRYGANEHLYGEAKTVLNNGGMSHTAIATPITIFGKKSVGDFGNIHRVGAALEFGMKATEKFTAIVGGGYQATIPEIEEVPGVDQSHVIHSYALFVQGQYAFSPNFALIPQIGWYQTIEHSERTKQNVTTKSDINDGGLLMAVQMRVTF